MREKILKIEDVSYSDNTVEILKNISISLRRGEVVALLGHNGSGKSTLIDLICQLMRPTNGKISLFENSNFQKQKQKIGVLWDDYKLPTLKVKELIYYFHAIYGIKEIQQEFYVILDLDQIKDRFFFQLSKGEKKRIAIYLTTFHHPELLILDEPTSELDPIVKDRIWKNIFLGVNERTILFTTHQWEDVKKYACRVYFISKGEIVGNGEMVSDLLNKYENKQKIIVSKNSMNIVPAYVQSSLIWEDEDNFYIIAEKNDPSIVNKIQLSTYNFSVLPIELKDIYQVLAKNKK